MIQVSAKNVFKNYRIYERPLDLLRELITGRAMHRTFLALNNVSMDLKQGECIGLVGRNGAGKSTFLKILAGTLEPTKGEVSIAGRVSAILELGTGFNPDYTGRDNIILGGMCMGMSREEITSKMEAIVDFSELRPVIDQPFRTYSSGMQARLTFSTAISIDPEILIVDEALATGDLPFVEKCLNRVEQIVSSGSTVILVSHNANLITRFAERAIWLEDGKIVLDDIAEVVAKKYQVSMYRRMPEDAAAISEIGDLKVRLVHAQFRGVLVAEPAKFMQGTDLAIDFTLESEIHSETIDVGLQICRLDGQVMWTASSGRHLSDDFKSQACRIKLSPGRSVIRIHLGKLVLNPDDYFINVGIEPFPDVPTVQQYHHWAPRFGKFTVVCAEGDYKPSAFESPSAWSILKGSSSFAV